MNDSNTTPSTVDLPPRRSAREHVSAFPQAVDNSLVPVDEAPSADPQLLVIGQKGEHPYSVIGFVRDWYEENGKPRVTLVTDDTPAGQMVEKWWANKGLSTSVYPLPETRRARRQRKERMLSGKVVFAFLFSYSPISPDFHDWLARLNERSIPYLVVQVNLG